TYLARLKSFIRVTFRPEISTTPVSGATLPPMVFSTVDLPAPFDPITVTKSPSANSRLMFDSATRSLIEFGKNVLFMFLSFSIGGLLECWLGFGRCLRFYSCPHTPLRYEQRHYHDDRRDQAHIIRVESNC